MKGCVYEADSVNSHTLFIRDEQKFYGITLEADVSFIWFNQVYLGNGTMVYL